MTGMPTPTPEVLLAWLRERGCASVQGYLLGRPMPAAELAALPGWAVEA